MGLTAEIRGALSNGPLSMRELADKLGFRTTARLHPYIHQMRTRTREVIVVPGDPKRLRLRKQHTWLTEWR